MKDLMVLLHLFTHQQRSLESFIRSPNFFSFFIKFNVMSVSGKSGVHQIIAVVRSIRLMQWIHPIRPTQQIRHFHDCNFLSLAFPTFLSCPKNPLTYEIQFENIIFFMNVWATINTLDKILQWP